MYDRLKTEVIKESEYAYLSEPNEEGSVSLEFTAPNAGTYYLSFALVTDDSEECQEYTKKSLYELTIFSEKMGVVVTEEATTDELTQNDDTKVVNINETNEENRDNAQMNQNSDTDQKTVNEMNKEKSNYIPYILLGSVLVILIGIIVFQQRKKL